MKSRLIILIVVLSACTPKPPELPPRPPLLPAPAKTSAPLPSSAPASSAAPMRPFDESLLTGREFLLEAPPVQARALDIRLGEMGAGGAAAAAAAILQAVAKGGEQPLDVQTLEPRWAEYLKGWARRAVKDGMSGTVRTGLPLPENHGGVMVPVRILGEKQEWNGWVFVVKNEASWLVSDVQLEVRDRDKTAFDPESPASPR